MPLPSPATPIDRQTDPSYCARDSRPHKKQRQETEKAGNKAGVIEQENGSRATRGIKHAFEWKREMRKNSRLPDLCCLLESVLADEKQFQIKKGGYGEKQYVRGVQ